ncbi:MAG TPA: glycosyltransferase family 2 protein [Nevskiaceae bacterium]|nr:glycosyltransferase family 2 protein [Nevskiaceae bacterium]
MKVSIVILNWNTKELLKQCLESLKKSRGDLETEVIVVDNGSQDGSVEMIKQFKSSTPDLKLHFIANKKNLGFARGNNQAIKMATGDFVMLLNSDTIVQKGAIEKLAVYLIKSPKIAVASPLLLNKDGSIQKDPCYLKFPSPVTAFFYYNSFLKKIAVKFFPWLLFSTTDFSQPVEVEQLPGAAVMFRKEVLKKLKGFDESYPLYFEDVDLSFRIRKLGYKLVVVPGAKIIHLGRKSIEPLIKKEGIEKFYFLNFSSLFLFCEKNYSKFKACLIKMIIFSHLLLTLRFSLIKKLIKR